MVMMMVPAERSHEAASLLNGRKGVKLSRMKAISVHQFGDPSVMKLEEVPDPVAAPDRCS